MNPPTDRPTARLLRVRVIANRLIPNRSSSQRWRSLRNDRLVCPWTVTNWVYLLPKNRVLRFVYRFSRYAKNRKNFCRLRTPPIAYYLYSASESFVRLSSNIPEEKTLPMSNEQTEQDALVQKSDYITHVYDYGWKLSQEQWDDRIRSGHSAEIARYFTCPRETRWKIQENFSKNAISNKCIRVKREYEYSFIRS